MKVFDIIFGKMIDRRIANYQNDLIQKQCEQIENIYRTMRGWRHDYHNHVQAMLILCDQNNLPELKKYLINLNDDLTTVDTSIKTGNVMIDAILNSKMSLIKARSIPVSAKAAAPNETDLSDIDLCVILGNLLDNAMEACVEQGAAEERFIRIYMGVMKKQLYISVQNTFSGRKKRTERLVSTKRESGHGYGLSRIDAVVKRNGGYINRQNEDGIFATEVMLPLFRVS